MASDDPLEHDACAIVGLAVRFPEAATVAEFWSNLCAGREAVKFFEPGDAGGSLFGHERHVPAYAAGAGFDQFDAEFFGYSDAEAAVIDPQQRVFLECAWEAFESAGYSVDSYRGRVGVFASSAFNVYLLRNILGNRDAASRYNLLQVLFSNDKDFLASRVSYKLNFTGPSINTQTACSSSLVAVQMACQSLQLYQSDMALAGGVALHDPLREGYVYQEDGMLSRDGHCRAFDAAASGMLMSSGAGIVVLKRLSEALEDGDFIHAIVRGAGINNDGSRKIGFGAPSVDGQAEAILEAHAAAGVDPASIGYIEAHGTGTSLGDPMEVAALVRAFRAGTSRKTFCALGSVTGNIGHLDAAAGIAGLIKAVLALRERLLPPMVNFTKANPQIDFAESPFFVNTQLAEWHSPSGPRRAGVSSFGIGGTNAHVILEEPPPRGASLKGYDTKVLLLSANSAQALTRALDNLRAHLKDHPAINLDDVAHTLGVGRKHFSRRCVITCRDLGEAVAALSQRAMEGAYQAVTDATPRLAFVFGDVTAVCPSLIEELKAAEPRFLAHMRGCPEALYPVSSTGSSPEEREAIAATFALGMLLSEWNVRPMILCGRGVGYHVACCLAESFSAAPRREATAMVGTPAVVELTAGASEASSIAADVLLIIGSRPTTWGGHETAGPPRVECLNGEATSDVGRILHGPLASLWARGVPVDWNSVLQGFGRRRVPLPTYPFQRKRHWIEPAQGVLEALAAPRPLAVARASEDAHTQIKALFARVLGSVVRADVASIDSAATFFDLGLDSVSLMQLSSEIESTLGQRIAFRRIAEELTSPRLILDHLLERTPSVSSPMAAASHAGRDTAPIAYPPTSVEQRLEELTREVELLRRSLETRSAVPDVMRRIAVGGQQVRSAAQPSRNAKSSPRAAPLSGAQREVWLAHWVSGDAAAAFNLCFAVRLSGPLNLCAMSDALRNVLRRHDALTMSYDSRGETQSSLAWDALDFGLIDLSRLDADTQDRVVSNLLREERSTPIDIGKGPPFRAWILRRSADDYVIVFDVHHIAFDVWSYRIFRQELVASHAAFLLGRPCELPASHSYAAYARDRVYRATSADREQARKVWQRFVAAPELIPRLPTDHPRMPFGTFKSARLTLSIEAHLRAGLRDVVRDAGHSSFLPFLAALQILLHRLTGEPRLVLGIAAIGSDVLDRQPMIGLSASLVPVFSVLDAGETFQSFLENTRRAILDAQEIAQFPLVEFLADGTISRNPAEVPPFSVVCASHRVVGSELSMFGGHADVIATGKSHVFQEIWFNVCEAAELSEVSCDFQIDLFKEATIQRWMGDYVTILERMVSDVNALVREERAPHLSVSSNESTNPLHGLDAAAYVHEWVSQRADSIPDRIAVEYRDQQLTYRELEARSNFLALLLQRRGVGPEDFVAVCVERSLDLVVCMLGVFKAGCVYVPLDPDLPAARLEAMLRETGDALLICDRAPPAIWSVAAENVLVVADIAWRSDADPPWVSLHPESLAYVMFTSGTTGVPKGIQVPHASLRNLVVAMRQAPGFDEGEVLVAVTTVSFDISLLELLVPIVSGGRVVLVDKDIVYDPPALRALLRDVGATTLQATPSLLQAVDLTSGGALGGLRILSGGESLPPGLALGLLRQGASVWEMYGPTEATIWCSCGRVDPRLGPVSLGDPVIGATMYLVNRTGVVEAEGHVGEIFVGGAGLARGYLHKPAQTASAFVPDVVASTPGRRAYRTGDAGRLLPNGRIQFGGRLDRQVKISGIRVELDEVEGVIAGHPGVQQCAVIMRKTPGTSDVLTAFVVGDASFSPWELRKRLRGLLPEAMIPRVVIPVSRLPRTAAGKVDYRALGRVESEASNRSQERQVRALSTSEQSVAAIWAEELGLEAVMPDDHFFDIGGNSFQAVRVMVRMQAELGISVSFAAFLFKTLAEMSSSETPDK